MVLAACNKDDKEKICVGFVTHYHFRISYFTRHLRYKHGAEVILCLYPQKRFLLCNISKMSCQIAGICYNKCAATFWQQKISKPL